MANIISRSMVSRYQRCQTAGFFAHRISLKSKGSKTQVALTRGVEGHKALENYYLTKQAGGTKDECLQAALKSLDQSIKENSEMVDEFTQLKKIMPYYVALYWDEPWEVVEVEKQYGTFLDNSTVEYGMRLDLLMRNTKTGDLVIHDAKFIYNFITDDEWKLDSQLPLYIHTLRKNGVDVKYAILNQIRYRELAEFAKYEEWQRNPTQYFKDHPRLKTAPPQPDLEKLFKRTVVKFKPEMIENFVRKFVQGQRMVEGLHSMPENEQLLNSTMALDKMVCGKCAFKPLCRDIINNRPWKRTANILYTRSDYGYTESAVEDV